MALADVALATDCIVTLLAERTERPLFAVETPLNRDQLSYRRASSDSGARLRVRFGTFSSATIRGSRMTISGARIAQSVRYSPGFAGHSFRNIFPALSLASTEKVAAPVAR
jgi:hypothetical protein